MSKVKWAAIALAVMLVCWMSVSASAALAAGWMVNGTQLLGLAKVKQVDPASYGEITIPGVGVRCEGSSFEVLGGSISSPAALAASGVVFKGCKTTAAACKLVGSTIEAEPLLGAGVTLEGALGVRGALLPERSFMELEFEGELCALAGVTIVVKGGVDFTAPEGQDERKSQLILLFSLAHQLAVGSSEVHFHFHGAVLLESEKPWSFL